MNKRASPSGPAPRGLPARVLNLAAHLPAEMLHDAALAAVRTRPARETIAIACSGGADSVALLCLLWAHLPERRGQWLVLHFNHRLRGRAATGDAAFVRRLARSLGERCVVGAWQRRPKRKGVPVPEAEARTARWEFFTDEMKRARVRVIALGHQLDDVAETMLMRLTRGSGTAGLAAPRPVQTIVGGASRVRPLLRITGKFLRSALQDAGLEWREDATNQTDDHFRNRVRRRVLPALIDAARSAALFSMGDARALLEEDDAALESWTDDVVPRVRRGQPYEVAILRAQPAAVVRRAIHRWARAVGLAESPSKSAVDILVWAIIEGRDQRLSAGSHRFIVLAQGKLSLIPAGSPRLRRESWGLSQLKEGGDLTGPRGDRLSLRRVRMTGRLFADVRRRKYLHASTVFIAPGSDWPGWLEVRAWQPGDRYRPFGSPGRAKLQDLFVNRRIPRELRTLLPVVIDVDGAILWVPGLPPAQEVAIQPASKLVVQLTYDSAPPTVHRLNTDTRPDV